MYLKQSSAYFDPPRLCFGFQEEHDESRRQTWEVSWQKDKPQIEFPSIEGSSINFIAKKLEHMSKIYKLVWKFSLKEKIQYTFWKVLMLIQVGHVHKRVCLCVCVCVHLKAMSNSVLQRVKLNSVFMQD